jgi:hypothetical protein
VRDFSLADVAAGDFVEVRGVETPAGSDALVASELRRDDPDDATTVQAVVDAETPEESLVILGITVQVDAQTQFRDALDNAITAADFFAAVEVGTLVKAKGTDLGGGVLGAKSSSSKSRTDRSPDQPCSPHGARRLSAGRRVRTAPARTLLRGRGGGVHASRNRRRSLWMPCALWQTTPATARLE